MSWRYRKISPSSFRYNKYLRWSAKYLRFVTLKNVVNLQVTSKVRPDISKSVLSKSRLHNLHAFIENILATEMCIKFESEEFSITGDYCSRSDSKEEDRGRGTVVCVA